MYWSGTGQPWNKLWTKELMSEYEWIGRWVHIRMYMCKNQWPYMRLLHMVNLRKKQSYSIWNPHATHEQAALSSLSHGPPNLDSWKRSMWKGCVCCHGLGNKSTCLLKTIIISKLLWLSINRIIVLKIVLWMFLLAPTHCPCVDLAVRCTHVYLYIYIPNTVAQHWTWPQIGNSCTLVPWTQHIARSAVPPDKIYIPWPVTLMMQHWKMNLVRVHPPTYTSAICQHVCTPLDACSVTFATKHPSRSAACMLTAEQQMLPCHTVYVTVHTIEDLILWTPSTSGTVCMHMLLSGRPNCIWHALLTMDGGLVHSESGWASSYTDMLTNLWCRCVGAFRESASNWIFQCAVLRS